MASNTALKNAAIASRNKRDEHWEGNKMSETEREKNQAFGPGPTKRYPGGPSGGYYRGNTKPDRGSNDFKPRSIPNTVGAREDERVRKGITRA